MIIIITKWSKKSPPAIHRERKRKSQRIGFLEKKLRRKMTHDGSIFHFLMIWLLLFEIFSGCSRFIFWIRWLVLQIKFGRSHFDPHLPRSSYSSIVVLLFWILKFRSHFHYCNNGDWQLQNVGLSRVLRNVQCKGHIAGNRAPFEIISRF